MRVLFLHPPWPGKGYGLRSQNRWPRKRGNKDNRYPLYLCYTATLLQKNGYDVKYMDSVIQDLDTEKTLEKVKELNPDIIFIESVTPTINYDIQLANKIKDISPNTKIIFAGYHVTVFPEEVLKNSKIDILVKGEQDYTTLEVVNAIRDKKSFKKIKGISYKINNKIYHNSKRDLIENLDELPFPDRDLIPHQWYIEGHVTKKPFTFLMTSRGCPNRCTFCLWPNVYFERKVRFRSIKNVADEIEWLIKKYSMKEIFIDDGTFNVSKERVMDFCNELLNRNIKIIWGCSARVDCIDEEMLNAMKKTGCKLICYGPESANPRTLELTNKKITLEQTKRAIELTKKADIIAHVNFMLGFPWETREEIENTINFCIKLKPDTAQFSLVFPHPGSEMYYEALEKEWFYPEILNNWDNFEMSKGAVLKSGIPKEELDNIISYAHKRFFFRPNYILSNVLKIRKPNDIKRLIKGAKSIIKGKILFKQ